MTQVWAGGFYSGILDDGFLLWLESFIQWVHTKLRLFFCKADVKWPFMDELFFREWHQTDVVIHVETFKNKRTTFFMRQTDSEAEFRLVLA